MLALQRGASNLYFPEVASSILIPPHSTRVGRVLSDPAVLSVLEATGREGEIADSVFQMAARGQVPWQELKEAYHALEQRGFDVGDDESSFRHAEYIALHQNRREEGDALACRTQDLEKYAPLVRDAFSGLTLVERLTETRALLGFGRIQPSRDSLAALSRDGVRWRPAFRVRGEGIFLELDSDRVRDFELRSERRLGPLLDRAIGAKRSALPISPRLVLMHTLAHLLIKRLSFEAGYGASSIRERIYASSPAVGVSMAGILLYTAAGDADGTLGGLVDLGRPGMLERALAGALEDARWCGSDPICAESRGQGPESLNLAACHACALLPETSCELQNRILDRTAVREFFGT